MNIESKVEFLSDPRAYGRGTARVEARETHMSWVFFADGLVYKLKKPVRYSFLDFGSLAKRRFFCEEELRLNRRLAAETYLATVPLRAGRDGRLSLGDAREGRIVDWLVVMKRLPEQEMLDARIAAGQVSHADIGTLAERLANFYAACQPQFEDGEFYIRHLFEEQAINRSLLMHPPFGLADAAAAPLDAADRSLTELTPLIRERIRQGCIVEGHGDLRPEHICLIEPLQIIDCLEFNRSMRIVDPYDELSYVGLECDMLGAGWIGPQLLDIVPLRLRPAPAPALLAFYRMFRALLRARLTIAHLLDRPVRDPSRWRPLALQYLAAARRECTAARINPGR